MPLRRFESWVQLHQPRLAAGFNFPHSAVLSAGPSTVVSTKPEVLTKVEASVAQEEAFRRNHAGRF